MKLDEYSDDFLIEILTSVKTIALVGAAPIQIEIVSKS